MESQLVAAEQVASCLHARGGAGMVVEGRMGGEEVKIRERGGLGMGRQRG